MTRLIQNRAQWAVVLALPILSLAIVLGATRYSVDLRLVTLVMIGLGIGAFIRSKGNYGSAAILMVGASLIANFYRYRVEGTSVIVGAGLAITSLVVGTWLIHLLTSSKKRSEILSDFTLPLLLLILINIISLGWSTIMRDPLVIPWDGFQLIQLLSLGLTGLLLLLPIFIGANLRDERQLKWIVGLICFTGIYAIFARLSQQDSLTQFIDSGTFGMFSAWFGAIALSLILFDKNIHPLIKLVLLGAIALWLFDTALLKTRWVTGWLPLMVALAVVIWRRIRLGVVLLGFVFLIFVIVQWEAVYQSVVVSNLEEGSGRRLDIWLANLVHIQRHPLFGSGQAGYVLYNRSYETEFYFFSSHNNFLDVILQTGIIGFSVFVWLLVSIFRKSIQTLRLTAGRGDFLEALSVGIFAGWVAAGAAMMLGDWILPFAYNQTILGFDNSMVAWVLAGCLIPLHRLAISETAGLEADQNE